MLNLSNIEFSVCYSITKLKVNFNNFLDKTILDLAIVIILLFAFVVCTISFADRVQPFYNGSMSSNHLCNLILFLQTFFCCNWLISKYNFPKGGMLTDVFSYLMLEHNLSLNCLWIFPFFPITTTRGCGRSTEDAHSSMAPDPFFNTLVVSVCPAPVLHFSF